MEYSMIPTTGEDLEGKVLVIRKSALKDAYKEGPRLFKASGGFGCSPNCSGTAVFGETLHDGEHARWNRSDFEGILDPQPSK